MSKASEWAARDKKRTAELEAARERIEVELGTDGKDRPGPFLGGINVLADVTHYDGVPRLQFRNYGQPQSLDVKRAIEFARWILDTFGESPEPRRGE